MICQKCNFQNEETAKFCRNCGVELVIQPLSPPATKTCSKCNFQNADDVLFCGKCGKKLYYKSQTDDTSSRLLFIFIILWFIITIWSQLSEPQVRDVLYHLGTVSLILPALVIKHKTLKIIGIALALLTPVLYFYHFFF